MSITPSPAMSKLLRELVGDRDVRLFIIDLTAGRLDPPRRIEVYLKLARTASRPPRSFILRVT